ncbi:Diacylglycerol O-acyltransferase 2B [Trametes pubescens]|uniref:Diacylglycerol O-acyltransferase n=1 Tax=Trametes pubescens TaxID=154538 RepID=A0A1M2VHW3_TRAPU|nr:Diacylglycerol O-acyltransferase 2B [Trametes pubescens]
MEVRKVFTSARRSVSSSSLRERLSSLSSLTTTPLKPVANLRAHIECGLRFSCLAGPSVDASVLQVRSRKDPEKAAAADACGRDMVDDDRTGFSAAFPGIVPHLLTLASNFRMPIYRDIILAMGICSVSKQSCSNILKKGPGNSITIVVGGAAESLSAHPGTADLTLRKRLGFIKIAIQHGADLVPVFSFGENDIFQQMPNEKGTTLYTLQKKFQNVFGFTLPLFHGRGLLNYNLGLMPYRKRIVAVIGRPIHVVQCDKPSLEEIRHVQEQYIDELMWCVFLFGFLWRRRPLKAVRRIWNTYKDDFARTRTRELSIIE